MPDRKYPTMTEITDAITDALGAYGSLSFDALVSCATKITGCEHRIPDGYVREAIQDVRRSRAPGGPALIVDSLTWRYELTADPGRVKVWLNMRENDTTSRAKTMLAQAEAAVEFTDGRSAAGKRARLEALHLGRLVEDLAALAEAIA